MDDGSGRIGEIAARVEAIVGQLRERPGDRRVEADAELGEALARHGRRVLEMRVDRRDLGIARERHLAGQAPVQHAPQGVDVGAAVHVLAADLLGGHVVDGPDELSGARDAGAGLQPLRHAEVGEERAVRRRARIRREQDVPRLHVAMDQPGGMGGIECRGRLRDQRDGAARFQPRLCSQEPFEIGALDVPHRDVQDAVGLARVVDRDDVRMVEAGGDLGLADEALPERVVIRELWTEDLQRDLAAQPDVLRQVDDRHPATADDAHHAMSGELGSHPRIGHAQSTGVAAVSENAGCPAADTHFQM